MISFNATRRGAAVVQDVVASDFGEQACSGPRLVRISRRVMVCKFCRVPFLAVPGVTPRTLTPKSAVAMVQQDLAGKAQP